MKLEERYLTFKNNDLYKKTKFYREVYEILKKSYEPIGGLISLKNPREILSDRFIWKLIRRDGRITACCLYKGTMEDRKLSLAGTDGSEEGKEDLNIILAEDIAMIDRGVWAELSGALEHIYVDKLNGSRVPADVAIAIMNYLHKNPERLPDNAEDKDIRYIRTIGNKKVKKGLVGYPPSKLVNNALKDFEYSTDSNTEKEKVKTF